MIPWTIGIRASYKRVYALKNPKSILDYIYGYLLNKGDAVIFYMKETILYWRGLIDSEKIFVAHNTVEVLANEQVAEKARQRILFLGSLYKEKMVNELMSAYQIAVKETDETLVPILDIVGGGAIFSELQAFVRDYHLEKNIVLHGPIYDEEEIAKLFSEAIICVSPNQAGLTVLKSMGYGVPFVTREHAITGGERLNIKNNHNGLFYNSKTELVAIIKDTIVDPQRFIVMGINAKRYYSENASPDHMVNGFIDAINHVSDKVNTIEKYGENS